MVPTSFLYEEKDGIGLITFNRPERLNALTFQVYGDLRDFFAELETRESVKVVVITGKGRGFCSGGDVEDIIGELFKRDMKGLLEFTRMTGQLTRNIRTLRKPVIASVNGVAAGAGAVIALASDFRIASEAARFAFLFVRVGLSGADMGATFLLPRVVGLAKATELLYTGEAIGAEEAYRIGLVNKVVKAEELEKETMALAQRLAKGPAFAIGVTKELLNAEMNMDLTTALEAEAEAQAVCMKSFDFQEAYDAWKDKREPKFQGR